MTQNYSSRFKVKNTQKEEVDNSGSTVFPLAVLLFLLFGNQDENIAKVAKKIILKNGTVTVQGMLNKISKNWKGISKKF